MLANPSSQGATTILEGENAELIEEIGRFDTIDELDEGTSTVNDLLRLEQTWTYNREMTSILQSIKNAGVAGRTCDQLRWIF